jgi:hypothetical protein
VLETNNWRRKALVQEARSKFDCRRRRSDRTTRLFSWRVIILKPTFGDSEDKWNILNNRTKDLPHLDTWEICDRTDKKIEFAYVYPVAIISGLCGKPHYWNRTVMVPLYNHHVRYIELGLPFTVTIKYPAVNTTPVCSLPRDHSEDTRNRFVSLTISVCDLPRSSNFQRNVGIPFKLNFAGTGKRTVQASQSF